MRLWALNIIFYVVQLNKKLRLLKVSNRSNMCCLQYYLYSSQLFICISSSLIEQNA